MAQTISRLRTTPQLAVLLAHGFLRLRCGDCGHDKLVAFSCKRRGFCPSCGAWRMAQTAARLVDHVIPRVPVRQWVRVCQVRLPIPLRLLLAAQPKLVTPLTEAMLSSGYDKYGQSVREGKALMEQTYKHIGPEVKDASKRYAGNNLACVSCHVESGGRKFGNPWVGTFVSFPQYRGREDAVSTTEERINGCMERSMNGRKLPLDSAEMKAMVSNLHFLSTGLPVGAKLEGGGTLKLKALARAADPVAGKLVYASACVVARRAMPMATSFRHSGVPTATTTALGRQFRPRAEKVSIRPNDAVVRFSGEKCGPAAIPPRPANTPWFCGFTRG